MEIIINITTIYISFIFFSVVSISAGHLLQKKFINLPLDITEKLVFGVIILSFTALFFNFFVSLNNIVNGAILIFLFLIFIYNYKTIIKTNKFFFKYIFFISILSILVLLYDNINRPDGPFYHLPYINFLNNEKIILGISNLNTRFGYISLWQYASAIFKFDIVFHLETILFPQLLVFSSLVLFFIIKIIKSSNSKLRLLAFLFLIVTLVDLSRYSDFGNDSVTHIIYFWFNYLIVENILLKNNDKNKFFSKILLISLFLFSLKLTYAIILLSIIFYFLARAKITLFNQKNFFITFLFLSLILKNILVSGCLFHPIKQSCINSIPWSDQQVEYENTLINAWSKGYPDSNTKLNFRSYSENFNWTKVWFNNHFKNKVIKEVLKVSIIIFFFYLFFRKYFHKLPDRKINIFALVNLIYIGFWFFYFPVYRFGSGFIFNFFCILTIGNYSFICENKKKIYSFILILLLLFTLKNMIRIGNRFNQDYSLLPQIKLNEKDKKFVKKYSYLNNDNFFYYHSKKMCYYSENCTSYDLNIGKLNIYNKFSYKLLSTN